MDTIKLLDQTIQLKGRLRMHLTPQGLVSSNGWSDESNCLLFEIGEEFHYDQGRKVEYTLRLRSVGQERPESSDSTKTMLFDSLNPMQAMLFDPSCLAQAVLYGANTDMTDLGLEDADLYEIAELPTRHIFLSEGEVAKPLMQRAIKRDVVTLGLFLDDAVRFLPALLADLAPSAPLRHVAIIPNFSGISSVEQDDVKLLVDALVRSTSSSQLEGVLFEISRSILPYGFISLLRTTTHVGMRFPESIYWSEAEAEPESVGSEAHKVKYLQVDGYCDHVFRQLNEFKASFTRLDLDIDKTDSRDVPLWTWLNLVNQSVSDLGLPINSAEDLKTLFDSKLHARIHVLRLRFRIDIFDEAWKLLVMDDVSTIQFFDCTFLHSFSRKLLQGLAGTKSPAALTALRIRFRSVWNLYDIDPDVHLNLAKYLSSPAACKLVYLDFASVQSATPEKAAMVDWDVANSLLNNFALCTFNFPFTETAAENYAITLLRRNRLYRDSHLSNEPQVKPNVAKLFLCGHGGVGKTTLRLALQSMQKPWPISSLRGPCCLIARPDRTRGMETHHLSLQHPHKKLLICDLAGQEEFYVFHHYFMNASINDIFIVVCKYDNTGLPLEHFRLQLEYWLRFIVSHRSPRNKSFNDSDANYAEMKPKVIVVVNFFQQEEHADNVTSEWASPLMQKFSEVLDFAVTAEAQHHNGYKNLFGLNARTRFRVQELERRLKALFRDFDNAALPIPELCYDISAHLSQGRSKNWCCANALATGKGKPRLLTSYVEVLNGVSKSKHAAGDLSSKVQAALEELHTQGYIIFFPTKGTGEAHGRSNSMKGECDGENSPINTLVITDTNWFSNKVVGSLLGGHLPGVMDPLCPWLWKVEEIKNMLRGQGCAEHEHAEILRYLAHLELCASLDSVPDVEKGYLLFPALVRDKQIVFPEGSKATSTPFFGRRIKCKDLSIHLVPFAVFTRLQVKLHRAYAADNKSFKLGYGWISFMRKGVGVVVRYGGDVINDASEGKQWIDILMFCPEIHGSNILPSISSNMESSGGYRSGHMDDPKLNAAEEILDDIRSHLYATCKEGGLGGIPTVNLEEMVLQNETESSDSYRLSDILNKVRTQELMESYQEWKTSTSTLVLDLLLPKEMEGVVRGRLNALASIQEEFSQGADDDGSEIGQLEQDKDKRQSGDAVCDSPGSSDLDIKSFIRTEMRLNRIQLEKFIHTNLQTVRADIRRLEDVQRRVGQTIIANCSTRLLRHELRKDRAYGLYPYLADVEGKLAPLWEALFGKRMVRVHFLCESPTEGGPHPVKGQKGKEVNIDWKPWVRKAARVMVPALKVICFLARVAASMYLPSAQVFIPSPEALVSGLGIETEALQQVILPLALEALLKNVPDVDLKEMMRCRPDEQEVQEVVAAILQNKEVDMWADFGLKRVIFDDDEQSVHHRPLWVCDHHARRRAELRPISNPYRLSESSQF